MRTSDKFALFIVAGVSLLLVASPLSPQVLTALTTPADQADSKP